MPESHARQLLGVGPLATPQEVQSAFRKLARVLHPDKSDSADATAKFQLILAAKNLLCPEGRPEEDPRDRQEREAREHLRREREAREAREREAREGREREAREEREREELAREYARLEREAQQHRG